jgi:hypothetical protein
LQDGGCYRSRCLQWVPIGTRVASEMRPLIIARTLRLATVFIATAAVAAVGAASSAAVAPTYHTTYQPGKIVPLASSIPHADGVMVDRRIVNNLRYLAQTYPIYVVEGYAGPLAGVGQVGCRKCHVKHSDHYNGLAVDIVPLYWDGSGCDRSWKPITRLAHWAEPRQNRPRLPFRWVGYNRDVNHGCGNHLHLSWDHAPAKPFTIADWVVVFDIPTQPPIEPPPPEPVPVPPPIAPASRESIAGP